MHNVPTRKRIAFRICAIKALGKTLACFWECFHKHHNLLTIKLHNTNLPTKNSPLHLLQPLKSLKSNRQIIILLADKNVGVRVLNKQTYLEKALAHLSDTFTYKPMDNFPLEELLHRLNSLVYQNLGTLSVTD